MAVTGPTYRFSRSPHLVDLIAEAERLAALVAGAPPAARTELADTRAAAPLRATLRLDGVPDAAIPDPETARERVGDAVPDVAVDADPAGSWLDAMRVLDRPSDELVRALEVLGVLAASRVDDLAGDLVRDPAGALAALHRRLTRGLVADDRAGRLRTTHQAVVDASTGRVLYFPPEPAAVARELALLAAWVASTGAREHALVTSGILHVEVLRIHPFEVANGRVARAAAGLLLLARGLDAGGLAVPDVWLADDPLGYTEEVARTVRRRDRTIWLERWGEAVTDALRAAARELGLLPADVPDRAAAFLDARDGDVFTVTDYRAEMAVGPETARADLQQLLDAGRVRRVPASRGLRFRPLAG